MQSVDDPGLPSLVTVGAVNFDSVPRDKAATLEKLLDTVRGAARQGCQLLVFPELALSTFGGCPDCAANHTPCGWHLDQAELVPGPATNALAKLAAELDIHVVFGMEELDPGDPGIIYNAAAVVTPDGVLGTYRKVHLGIPLETDRFTPGNALPVFETRLGPIGISICYDFYNNPELSRILAFKGARILLNPTGSNDYPGKAEMITHTTLVRAQENLVYAISANRVGTQGGQPWAGNSVIGGPAFPGFGHVLAEAGKQEQVIMATLNFTQLDAWYDWLPWRDWRMGPQGQATRLVADEFAALAANVESDGQSSS